MNNSIDKPAQDSRSGAGPQGEQEQFEITSPSNYFKITVPKLGKIPNKCKCYACIDSQFEYGKSSVLIEDTNPLIVSLFGRDLTK